MGENGQRIRLAWIIKGAEEAQKKINMYYSYLNHHLDLYSKAIEDGNIAELAFHEDKLHELRNILIELEYFSMGEKENGKDL
jgi:hypothetical protein